MPFILPAKLPQYLLRAKLLFERQKRDELQYIITSSRYFVREQAEFYDNGEQGVSAHDVVFFLNLEDLTQLDEEGHDEKAGQIAVLLNQMNRAVGEETFRNVVFELADPEDAEFQRARQFSRLPEIDPDRVDFWKPGLIRLFISHRDAHKVAARDLGEVLEGYGFSCFVAHDTIAPRTEWKDEIIKGLQTMEAMLVFLTDDFAASEWCEQEVGYALGRGVPIISLKLGRVAPPGFISSTQSLRGDIGVPARSAAELFHLVAHALDREERLADALIQSLVLSPSWPDTATRFDRLKAAIRALTDKQVATIQKGYKANDQLYAAAYLENHRNHRLIKWLRDMTGRDFEIEGRELRERKPAVITVKPSAFVDKPLF